MTYCNKYLEKIASDELDQYAQGFTNYHEPIAKNVLTGSSYGMLGGTMYGFGKSMEHILNTPVPEDAAKRTAALAEVTRVAQGNIGKATKFGALAGSGAGLVYGLQKHLRPRNEHVNNHSHIEGVQEFSARHIDPYMGGVAGGFLGGVGLGKLKIPTRAVAGPLEKQILTSIPGIVGAVAGAKAGTYGVKRYNDYVLDDVRKNYYGQ